MRLTEGFVTHETEGEQVLVATGEARFAGIVRSNRTAAFIVEQLKEEITREQLIDAMCDRYDAPGEVIGQDVDRILEALRSIGALDEKQL